MSQLAAEGQAASFVVHEERSVHPPAALCHPSGFAQTQCQRLRRERRSQGSYE